MSELVAPVALSNSISLVVAPVAINSTRSKANERGPPRSASLIYNSYYSTRLCSLAAFPLTFPEPILLEGASNLCILLILSRLRNFPEAFLSQRIKSPTLTFPRC